MHVDVGVVNACYEAGFGCDTRVLLRHIKIQKKCAVGVGRARGALHYNLPQVERRFADVDIIVPICNNSLSNGLSPKYKL